MYTYICIYIYIYVHTYIYIYIERERGRYRHSRSSRRWTCPAARRSRRSGGNHLSDATPSPPTKSLDFRGFDSSRLLILRGGNSYVRRIVRGGNHLSDATCTNSFLLHWERDKRGQHYWGHCKSTAF